MALVLLSLTGCAGHRLVRLENRVLMKENHALSKQVLELESQVPGGEPWAREIDLETVRRFLAATGREVRQDEPGKPLRFEFSGANSHFSVILQVFPETQVLFIGTRGLFRLEDVRSTESIALLLVQLLTWNYEMVVGKFQVNPESGEVIVSTELYIDGGLGAETLDRALTDLCRAADQRLPQLERIAAGAGL